MKHQVDKLKVNGRGIISMLILCLLSYFLALLLVYPGGVEGGNNNNQNKSLNVDLDTVNITGFPRVNTYFNVTDEEGVLVKELTEENFKLTEKAEDEEKAVKQAIDVTTVKEADNLAVALAIDRSGSMSGDMADAREAAKTMVDNLSSEDRGAIISYSGSVTVDQEFTGDNAALKEAIQPLSAGGFTALYDAICESIEMSADEIGVPAVLAFTDGIDNRSDYSEEDVINLAQSKGIPVYTIGLGNVDEEVLENIAQETGGSYYYTPDSSELKQIYQELSKEIQDQYLLTYETHNQDYDGTTRTIELTAEAEGKTGTDTIEYAVAEQPPQIYLTRKTKDLLQEKQTGNQPLGIEAKITSEEGVKAARLFYRTSGSGEAYQEVDMQKTEEEDKYLAEIPASEVVTPGVDFYMVATDGIHVVSSPGERPAENAYQVPVKPNKKPVIAHDAVSTAQEGKDIDIIAEVSEEKHYGPIQEVELYYRQASSHYFESVEMSLEETTEGTIDGYEGTVGIYKGAVPGSEVTLEDIEYYIMAKDKKGVRAYEGESVNIAFGSPLLGPSGLFSPLQNNVSEVMLEAHYVAVFTDEVEVDIEAGIGEPLLELIDKYGGETYNDDWAFTEDQYKVWLATIAWGESQGRGYTNHGTASGDVFFHKNAGNDFFYSCGIGPFQMDWGFGGLLGDLEAVCYWSTLEKLDIERTTKAIANWHENNVNAGDTLADVQRGHPWFAIYCRSTGDGHIQNWWKEVTGTEWESEYLANDYASEKYNGTEEHPFNVNWRLIKGELKDNAQDLEGYKWNPDTDKAADIIKESPSLKWSSSFPIIRHLWNVTFSLKQYGVEWNIDKDDLKDLKDYREDENKEVNKDLEVKGELPTWRITGRTLRSGNTTYYYTYLPDEDFEVWVWDDPDNEYKDIFVNDYSIGGDRAHRPPVPANGITLDSSALEFQDNYSSLETEMEFLNIDIIEKMNMLLPLPEGGEQAMENAVTFTYTNQATSTLTFGVFGENGTSKLEVYKPNGELYETKKCGDDPAVIEVSEAMPGTWEYKVAAVDSNPSSEIPVAVMVGETRPRVEKTVPGPGEKHEITCPVEIVFDRPVEEADLDGVTLENREETIEVSPVTEDKKLVVEHEGMSPEMSHTITVPAGAISCPEKNEENKRISFNFTTREKKSTEFEVHPDKLELEVGEREQVKLDFIEPGTDYNAHYKISEPGVATVAEAVYEERSKTVTEAVYKVTAEKPGSTEIDFTGEAKNYKPSTETIEVEVYDKDPVSSSRTGGGRPTPPPEPVIEPEEPQVGPQVEPEDITRLYGADRYETAVEISHAAYRESEAEAVILARGDNYPDALAGGPLAMEKGGPLLLTQPEELPQSTAAEIQRVLQPGGTVYLLGGPAAVSADIEEELSRDYTVERLSGQDRYETAVAVAEAMNAPEEIFLVTGRNFPDAVSASSAAAQNGAPVLLTAPEELSPAASRYLTENRGAGVKVIGGTAAVSNGVYREAGGNHRIAGANRWETAVEVAETFFNKPEKITLATGLDYPDALTGGVYAAALEAPVLLSRTGGLPPEIAEYLNVMDHPLEGVCIYGGPGVLSPEVKQEIKTKLD